VGSGKEKKLSKEVKALKSNSIAIITLTKYREDKPFTIQYVDLIAEPLTMDEVKEEESP
jgi:hypothetical protein